MIKPSMPGMGAMNDTLDFMKNLWGGMGMSGASMPAMVMPTLSVEEIHKKIADLKAVESWLTLNMNMLRSTIQALEVQAATISTLQSMGEQFSAGMNAASQAAKDMQSFGASPSAPATPPSSSTRAPSAAPSPESMAFTPPPFPFPTAAAAPSVAGAASTSSRGPDLQPTNKDQADAANLAAPLVNAAAWWNLLQDQFKQAVSSAMTTEPAASVESKPESKPQSKPESTATKTPAKPRTKVSSSTFGNASPASTRKPRASR